MKTEQKKMTKTKVKKMKAKREKKKKMAGQFYLENCIVQPPYFFVI